MRALQLALLVTAAAVLSGCGTGKALVDTAGERDGGTVDVALTAVGAACSDLQTDPRNCGACGHDCNGGGCSAGSCQPVVLADGLEQPGKLAIDDVNVYWTEPVAGQIKKVAKAGGTPVVMATGLPRPGAIAVQSGNIYWTDSVAGTVSTLPIDGGSPVILAAGQPGPDAIAVDATDVYFWNIDDRTIRRVRGSVVVTVASMQVVVAIALDATSVYWATVDDGRVQKLSRDGGTVVTLAASTLTYPSAGSPADYGAWGIAVNGSTIYWTDRANVSGLDPALVLSVPLDGGPTRTLATQRVGALAITVDPSGIYWTESAGVGNIATLRGGQLVVLASRQENPQSIATDAANVYWLNFGPNGTAGAPSMGGAVMRVAK